MTLATASLARAANRVQAGAPGAPGESERRRTAGRLANWVALAVLAVACVVACELRGYRIDWRHLSAMAIILAVVVAISLFYTYVRDTPDNRLGETLHEAALLVAAWAPLGALSYLAAGLGLPYVDPQLAALDRALGFDWHAWRAFVHGAPGSEAALRIVYFSSFVQIYALVFVAGLAGLGDRVRELVALLIATGIVVVVLSGLFPAQSAWVHYDIDLHKAYHLADLSTLRGQAAQVIDVGRQTGIVTFPSYHTAISLILVWVTRGIAPLFWPALALNAGVLVAIPTEGGHYLVDMLAGAAITALACLWIARRDRAAALARPR